MRTQSKDQPWPIKTRKNRCYGNVLNTKLSHHHLFVPENTVWLTFRRLPVTPVSVCRLLMTLLSCSENLQHRRHHCLSDPCSSAQPLLLLQTFLYPVGISLFATCDHYLLVFHRTSSRRVWLHLLYNPHFR